MKNYMVKLSWEYTDYITDFDSVFVDAENAEDAGLIALTKIDKNDIQQIFIDEVWERVQ